jgi:hypothetical protein
MWELLS